MIEKLHVLKKPHPRPSPLKESLWTRVERVWDEASKRFINFYPGSNNYLITFCEVITPPLCTCMMYMPFASGFSIVTFPVADAALMMRPERSITRYTKLFSEMMRH